ncbi:MAG: glycosyltransferase [Dokdonella sp.]
MQLDPVDVDRRKPRASASKVRPLVTFALFAYNQEAYVREAVRAALAQDYRPLQIIFSDDASTDRTFELMQEEACACPSGVEIVLNRNELNLGIANHINQVVRMAAGDYLVLASGDDVSLPQRASASVHALINDLQGRMALHSAVINMDHEGNTVRLRQNPHRNNMVSPETIIDKDVYLTGSSVTVNKSLYADFPPLHRDVVNEDKVTAFRSAFRGGAIYIEQPLVRYREGVGVSTLNGTILSGREDPAREAKYVKTGIMRRLAVLRQMKIDCLSDALLHLVEPALLAKLDRDIKDNEQTLRFMETPKLVALPSMLAAQGFNRETAKVAVLYLMPCLYRRYKLLSHHRVKT